MVPNHRNLQHLGTLSAGTLQSERLKNKRDLEVFRLSTLPEEHLGLNSAREISHAPRFPMTGSNVSNRRALNALSPVQPARLSRALVSGNFNEDLSELLLEAILKHMPS